MSSWGNIAELAEEARIQREYREEANEEFKHEGHDGESGVHRLQTVAGSGRGPRSALKGATRETSESAAEAEDMKIMEL